MSKRQYSKFELLRLTHVVESLFPAAGKLSSLYPQKWFWAFTGQQPVLWHGILGWWGEWKDRTSVERTKKSRLRFDSWQVSQSRTSLLLPLKRFYSATLTTVKRRKKKFVNDKAFMMINFFVRFLSLLNHFTISSNKLTIRWTRFRDVTHSNRRTGPTSPHTSL